jgi:hypothetical protein
MSLPPAVERDDGIVGARKGRGRHAGAVAERGESETGESTSAMGDATPPGGIGMGMDRGGRERRRSSGWARLGSAQALRTGDGRSRALFVLDDDGDGDLEGPGTSVEVEGK